MKTTISVTVDPIVLQKFDALIENRSKEIEAMMQKRAEEEQKEFEVEIAHNICAKIAREDGEQKNEICFRFKGYDVALDSTVYLAFYNNDLAECALILENFAVFEKGEQVNSNLLPTIDDDNVAELIKQFI